MFVHVYYVWLYFVCNAEKLLEEILARVEDGELPDAAETEAQWSSFISTAMPSNKSRIGGSPESTIHSDKVLKGSRVSGNSADSLQGTEGHSVAGSSTSHRKRKLAPVDEGNHFVALHATTRDKRELEEMIL